MQFDCVEPSWAATARTSAIHGVPPPQTCRARRDEGTGIGGEPIRGLTTEFGEGGGVDIERESGIGEREKKNREFSGNSPSYRNAPSPFSFYTRD